MAAPKTKKELEGERTRAQVLDAAERLFAERGYRATSVAVIAKACGISTATVFWHFQSKEGLLQAIFTRMMDELQAIMAEKRGTPDKTRKLPVLAPAEFDYFTEHADRMRMMLGLVMEADTVGGKLPEILRTLLRSYVALLTGQMRATNPRMDPEEARERATVFVASLAGILVLRVTDTEFPQSGDLVGTASRLLLDLHSEDD